ncbi:hypothetical protein MMC17_003675 [Xylographa soralifera]|nr:hypothetical protein [Xylographa soralifera]
MSLTIYTNPAPLNQYIPVQDKTFVGESCESTEAENVWLRFRDLPCRLQSMKKLTTFSFIVLSPSQIPHFREGNVMRQGIARIILSLPETCSALEIDTRGEDFDLNLPPGSFHLCDAIRAMLPRLKHLRLRTRMLCSYFYGEKAVITSSTFDSSHFRPTAAPNLDTLVVNCVPYSPFHTVIRLCQNVQDAQPILAECLQALVKQGKYPESKRFYLLGSQNYHDAGQSTYAAFNRRDIIQNTTWTIPCRQITDNEDDHLIRMPDGGEYLSDTITIAQLAEGELWQETTKGIRLPHAVLAEQEAGTYGRTLKHLPYESSRDWKARNPKTSCTLWRNETATGVKLLDAERRDGITGTLPLVEKTPTGWVRHGSDLVPEQGRLSA